MFLRRSAWHQALDDLGQRSDRAWGLATGWKHGVVVIRFASKNAAVGKLKTIACEIAVPCFSCLRCEIAVPCFSCLRCFLGAASGHAFAGFYGCYGEQLYSTIALRSPHHIQYHDVVRQRVNPARSQVVRWRSSTSLGAVLSPPKTRKVS